RFFWSRVVEIVLMYTSLSQGALGKVTLFTATEEGFVCPYTKVPVMRYRGVSKSAAVMSMAGSYTSSSSTQFGSLTEGSGRLGMVPTAEPVQSAIHNRVGAAS